MRVTLCISLVALALVATGCGSSDGGDSTSPPQPQPTAQPADFPSATGKSLNDLAAMAETKGPVLAPSVSVLTKGQNRFGFALFDLARKQITGTAVAVYTARNDGSGLRGPYVARSESLAVKPQFQSKTTASDPDAAKAVYVADVPFKANGKRIVIGLARLDGRLLLTNPFSVSVGDHNGPPRVGEKAIRVHTKTLTDVGGDGTQLDTRRPVAEDLLADDFADVMGKRPAVITFATPLLCQSRVCGPVVDVVEQVKATAPKDVAFIHQEIYNGNAVNKGFRPQVAAWRLPTEPWTFVIGRDGRIAERLQGAFSPGELQRAVAAAAR
ncbi:MAG: hypothetical protein ABI950_07190 [Solirubrobacteraceae bacterium]